ncbi:MAG: hypothetical protein EHM58_04815 [Ignavibacteriae bacterium]|nr:MAG: hypothetical protein EHM58_04815 [Ignavibacteriota bacterium]
MDQGQYRTSFDQPMMEQKVYGRSRGFKGCLLYILLFIILMVGLAGVGVYLYTSVLFPNKIKGDLLNVTYVPGKDAESGKLWIVTDGSFSYIQETKSPGKYSVGREGIFCKTWTYIYDPVNQQVLKKLKTDYDELPPRPEMFTKDGNVWIVSQEQFDYEPMINIFNAETMEPVMDTKGFISKHEELSSGIINLSVTFEEPRHFNIKTRDGQSFVYSIELDELFTNYNDLRVRMIGEGPETVNIFALGEKSSGPRKVLYRVTGPAKELKTNSLSESYLDDANTLKFFTKSTAQKLTPDKVYLEGLILYQDKDAVVILHQDQVGKNASRMLTCVGTDGKLMWTKNQDELFEELAVTEDDAFSVIFFMKSKIKATREGNLLLFKFEPKGIIGFDFNSGKKLWTLEI